MLHAVSGVHLFINFNYFSSVHCSWAEAAAAAAERKTFPFHHGSKNLHPYYMALITSFRAIAPTPPAPGQTSFPGPTTDQPGRVSQTREIFGEDLKFSCLPLLLLLLLQVKSRCVFRKVAVNEEKSSFPPSRELACFFWLPLLKSIDFLPKRHEL